MNAYGHKNIKVQCCSVLHFTDPEKDTTHIGTNQSVIEGIFNNNTWWIHNNLNNLLDADRALEPGSQRSKWDTCHALANSLFSLSLSLSLSLSPGRSHR